MVLPYKLEVPIIFILLIGTYLLSSDNFCTHIKCLLFINIMNYGNFQIIIDFINFKLIYWIVMVLFLSSSRYIKFNNLETIQLNFDLSIFTNNKNK